MSGRLLGDFASLARLRSGVERVGREGFRECMQGWASQARALVAEDFAAGRSPAGAPWRATIAGNAPLKGRTGRLEATAVVMFTAHGLKVHIPLRYAAIHQWGGKAGRGHAVTIPARPFLPSERPPDLPPDWEQALNTSVRVMLSRHLG